MQHTLHTIPFDIPTCSIYTLHISIQSYSSVSTNLLSIWVPRSFQVGYPEDIISEALVKHLADKIKSKLSIIVIEQPSLKQKLSST